MLQFLKRAANSGAEVPIEREQFERVLKISQNLLASLYQFDRQRVWSSITEEIRILYNCELVSLFLVDEDDLDYLILKNQSPSRAEPEKVRLKIVSAPQQGITGHVAKEGKTTTLGKHEIASSPYVRNRMPYLNSGICYSALLVPLKNRKGKLVGVLRLNNKNIDEAINEEPFTTADTATIEHLAVEIVALLENVHAFDALRSLIGNVQRAGSTDDAVQCILSCAVKLLNASQAKLGLWSPSKKRLVFAGVKNVPAHKVPKKGDEIDANNVMVALWNSVVERQRPAWNTTTTREDDDVWLNFGPQYNRELRRCDPDAKSSISVVIQVHQQPVGVLHLESFDSEGFDDLDRQVLKVLAQNVSIAIQSIGRPWQLPDEDTFESGQEELSLGEAGGFFQSVVRHTPLVMWRKDADGKLIWVNDRFCTHLEMKRKGLLGKTDFELFPKDLAERYLKGDEMARQHRKFEDPEEPFDLPNGERSVIHVFKEAFHDHLGSFAGTQGVFLDVSGDKYRQLFREAPIGFFELNETGGIFHANKAGREMLGYTEVEIMSKSFSDLSGDSAVTEEIVAKHLKGNEREGEWRQPINLRKKDGTTIPVSIASRRVTDSSNKPTGLLCAVREISAGVEIEEALRDPDSRYLARIRELSMPVFRLDKDLKTIFVNDALVAEAGLPRSELLGKTSYEIFRQRDPELAKQYDEDNKSVLNTGKVLDKIEFHHQTDGEKIIVRVLKFPVRDSKNQVNGVQGVFWRYGDQDFAKKALADALEQAKEEYRQIVQGAGEGIFQSTVDGQFIAANPAMVRLLGYQTEEELLKEVDTGIKRFDIDGQQKDYFKWLGAAEPGISQVIDYKIRKRSGQTIWVSETAQKVVDRQNRQRVVGFVMDITERHQAAEAKEDMLRMLAHQLRSPAWQCFKRSDNLVRRLDPNETLISGENISQEARAAATIRGLARKTRGVAWSINMMSTLAHSDRVELTPKALARIPPRKLIKVAREAARDAQLIRRVSASFKERMMIKTSVPQIEIEVENSKESNFRIIGDLGLIEQSLGCVIENAFKYSKPSSTIKIHCSLEREFVTLSIMNQPVIGLEIDRQTREKCREKEWRSDAAKGCDADGTGLGLWLVDRIMIAHKGTLHVYETDDEGWNRFSLHFPLKPYSEFKKII